MWKKSINKFFNLHEELLPVWTARPFFTKIYVTFCRKLLFMDRFLHKKLDFRYLSDSIWLTTLKFLNESSLSWEVKRSALVFPLLQFFSTLRFFSLKSFIILTWVAISIIIIFPVDCWTGSLQCYPLFFRYWRQVLLHYSFSWIICTLLRLWFELNVNDAKHWIPYMMLVSTCQIIDRWVNSVTGRSQILFCEARRYKGHAADCYRYMVGAKRILAPMHLRPNHVIYLYRRLDQQHSCCQFLVDWRIRTQLVLFDVI